MIVCYDGSREAIEALAYTARLLPGARVIVLTVWKPISEVLLAVSLGPAPLISDPAEADDRQRRAAEQLAQDGTKRAARAGLKAEPVAVRGEDAVWEAIVEVADEHDASLVVCGSHGHILLDRVPIALLQHAHRPVLVVPSPQAQEPKRAKKLRTVAT